MIDPLRSDTAPLIVYMDYKSPYAYLAKEPTCNMADELGIAIDWRPLTLDIPSYLGSARIATSGSQTGKVVESSRSPRQWAAVKYAYRDAKRYARQRGITLLGTQKIWDSRLASIGMQWAAFWGEEQGQEQGEEIVRRYHDAVYEPFWRRELDIEDIAVIVTVLRAAGAITTDSDEAAFRHYANGDGGVQHDTLQGMLHPAGIFGVPTYVVQGELFFGREHLPMVRWILEGRPGKAPDIAYDAPASVQRS